MVGPLLCLCVCSGLAYAEYETLDPDSLPITEKPLFVPELEEVAKALKDGLTSYFASVDTRVDQSPDFTQKPFYLVAQGLGGSSRFVDVGGNSNLLPTVNLSKVYDFKFMNQWSGLPRAALLGCGTGPFMLVHSDPELVVNMLVADGKVVKNLNAMAYLPDSEHSDAFKVMKLPQESRFGLLATVHACEGKPGKIVKVVAKKRTGKDNFVAALRQTMKKAFPGKSVGMVVVFTVKGSDLNMHVTGDFSKVPLHNDAEVTKWLRFYNMSSPMTVVGSVFTDDVGLNVRVQNPHGYNELGQLGHYHGDLSPDTVEYTAYIALGDKIIRVDQSKADPNFGNE